MQAPEQISKRVILVVLFALNVKAFNPNIFANSGIGCAYHARPRNAISPWSMQTTSGTKSHRAARSKPAVKSISFAYEFPKVPFEMGIQHIHSPEHISETHRFGAPFFKLLQVLPPKLSASKASITYSCSTLLLSNLHVRMYTSRPDQSNMLFLNAGGKALYQVRLTVIPTDGFSSHRLTIDISLFTGWIPRALIAVAMPFFLFINGLEDRLAFARSDGRRDANGDLDEYRRHVAAWLDSRLLELASEVYQRYRAL